MLAPMEMWNRAAPLGMTLWLVVGGCGISQSNSDADKPGGDATSNATTSGVGGSSAPVDDTGSGGATATSATSTGVFGTSGVTATGGSGTSGVAGTGGGGTTGVAGTGGTAGAPATGGMGGTPIDAPQGDGPDAACAGQGCGAPCSTCAVGDADCLATGEAHVCNALGQCQLAPVACSVSRPFCAATAFEDTGDDCIEESWSWDGDRCTLVTHCGCASGDCDRLYADRESCETAHAACLPSFCAIQDATEAPAPYGECPQIAGYAFDGVICRGICECEGEDCADLEPTEEACNERFASCLERTPECTAGHFPVEAQAPGYLATYPEYGFSVEGFDRLYDEETRQVAVFPQWTRAEWIGWEEPAEPANCLPLVPRFEFDCPSARPLVLQVEDQVFRILITLHWQSWIEETVAPSEVEVRIAAHPSGSLVLQIRDVATELPVVMVVRSESEASGLNAAWEFFPFTFSPGEPLCQTAAGACNWTFAARGLAIETPEVHWTLDPLERAQLGARQVNYAALHGYIFEQGYVAPEACSERFVPRQNFALLQLGPMAQ